MTTPQTPKEIPSHSLFQEAAAAAAKATASLMPGAGPFVSEFVGLCISTPLGRRRDAWLNDLAARLRELERRGLCPDFVKLGDDPSFVSTVTQATVIAMKNHQQAKLDALRNAVVNTAVSRESLDDDVRAMLLACVDALTPSHMRLLRFLDMPKSLETYIKAAQGRDVNLMGNLSLLFKMEFPETDGAVSEQQTNELHARGLVTIDSLEQGPETRVLSQSTQLGKQLLALISLPPDA